MSERRAGVRTSPAHGAKRWFLHRTVLFLGILALCWAGWAAYSHAAARAKMDEPLFAALGKGQPLDIVVDLAFPPEEFHVRFLQERGTVTGVQGSSVRLLRVRPGAAWSIARLYWVKRVRGAPGF